MPLVSDFTDVLQIFANGDLLPATWSRVVSAPQFAGGVPVPGTGGYVNQGALPAAETVIHPAKQDEDSERDEKMPAGERARARIFVYTSIQLRAGRAPNLRPDRVTTADGRQWQVAKAEDWSYNGNFWVAECELLDVDPA